MQAEPRADRPGADRLGADGLGADRPTIGALFAGFFSIGICGFGGVLPWARRMIVERRHWLSAAEFTDLLALCQFLPGPNVINLSVALGSRFRGPRGALAAFFGLMSAPMVIVLLLGMVYQRYAGLPGVRHMFAGLAAAASGLVLSTALKIAAPLRHRAPDVLMAVGSWAAIVLLHAPLIPAMLVLAPLGILIAARAPR